MIRVIVGLFFVTLVDWADGQGIFFENDRRHFKPAAIDSSGFSDRKNRHLMNNPSSIDRRLQIPITVIQGSSVTAQSSLPQNKNAVNKFFDSTAQPNLLNNKNSDQYNLNQANRRQDRRERLLEIREIELKRRQQIIEQKRMQQQQRIEEKKLFDDKRKEKIALQHKMQENNDDDDDDADDHSLEKRQARFFNLHGWSSALTDVLWEELGLGHGHGYGHGYGYGNIFNNGGHHGIFDGNKKKKKKKKKPLGSIWNNHGHQGGHGGHLGGHGGHLGGHGGHLGGHGGHLGGHGSHGNYGLGSYGNYGHGSNGIYGGLQQFISGLNNHYQVTENVDDIPPQRPLFGWQRPFRDEEKIENKIAPGFDENSRSN